MTIDLAIGYSTCILLLRRQNIDIENLDFNKIIIIYKFFILIIAMQNAILIYFERIFDLIKQFAD